MVGRGDIPMEVSMGTMYKNLSYSTQGGMSIRTGGGVREGKIHQKLLDEGLSKRYVSFLLRLFKYAFFFLHKVFLYNWEIGRTRLCI